MGPFGCSFRSCAPSGGGSFLGLCWIITSWRTELWALASKVGSGTLNGYHVLVQYLSRQLLSLVHLCGSCAGIFLTCKAHGHQAWAQMVTIGRTTRAACCRTFAKALNASSAARMQAASSEEGLLPSGSEVEGFAVVGSQPPSGAGVNLQDS